jgi:hypothetical protein
MGDAEANRMQAHAFKTRVVKHFMNCITNVLMLAVNCVGHMRTADLGAHIRLSLRLLRFSHGVAFPFLGGVGGVEVFTGVTLSVAMTGSFPSDSN